MEQVLYSLPDGWEWKTLGDVCLKVTDGSHNPPKGVEVGLPMLSSRNVMDNGLIWDNFRLIPEDAFENEHKRTRISEGDVLLTIVGTIGRSCVVRSLDRLFTLQRSVAVLSTEELIPEFLSYQFKAPFIQEHFISNAKGSAQKGIYLKQLKATNLVCPPIEEQKRIVEKLDALLTRIDTAIEHLQESVTLADAFYASALDKEFSKLMKESDILPFKKLVDNQDGRRIPIKAGERKNTHGTYPYYGATGVIDYVDDFIFEGERLLISEDGANLVARKYPIAFIADGKYWVNNHAHVVNALPELTSNLYLKKFFAWVDLSSYITGSAQPKLSQGKLNTIPVPVPPLSEQTEIVAELDKAYQLTENLKKGVGEKLGMLTSLKASILDSAFKGEL